MKIGHLENLPPVAQAAIERNMERKAAASAAKGEASAQVDLSATAATLSGQDGLAGSFDAAKVDRIAQAIRDGKFEINPEAIADKLIANAQELLGRSER